MRFVGCTSAGTFCRLRSQRYHQCIHVCHYPPRLSRLSLQANEEQSPHLPIAAGRREEEGAVRDELQATQSQIAGKARSIHHRRRRPTAAVTSPPESKGMINVGRPLETVQPAGIMHYGAAFTHRYVLMMSCSGREVMERESQIMLMIVERVK